MSLAELSIKRPWFITCLVIVMLAVGILSFNNLGVDLFPDVNFPVVTVTTDYSGAGPSEIETLITKPMEDEMSTISGLKRLTSKSLEGVSQVVAEFYLETDIKYAEQQVRDKVSVAKTKIPREAKEPVVRRVDPSDQPILTLALRANLPPAQVYDLADQVVKNRIQQVNDVGLVEIVGGRKREIHVNLNRKKLKQRELSVLGVASQIRATGENVPAGKVNQGTQEAVFRSLGEFPNTAEITKVILNFFGNEIPTQIADVGTVEDTLEDEKTRAFVDGKPALFIDIYRQSGSNTLAVVNAVKLKLKDLEKELKELGNRAELMVVRDGSKEIRDNVDDVEETILIGILLTVVVVYLFLANGRSTLITGLALPNSLVGSFILMSIAGYTINIVSLLALSLAVGLLIDDAIVVRENIFRHLEEGKSPVESARSGTKEVQLAVVATTLVVMAVFGPVAFTRGIIGQFLKQFGLTVCFAMAISLFDALTIAPMLSAYFAGGIYEKQNVRRSLWYYTGGAVLRGFARFQNGLEYVYEHVLKITLNYPKTVLFLSFLVFLGASATLRWVPKTFLPPQDNGEFIVALDMPPGTSLPAMNEVAAQIDQKIRSFQEVEYTALTVGGKNDEPNEAEIYIRLIPSRQRKKINTSQMKDQIRGLLTAYRGANPKVKDYDPTGGAAIRPFAINILGSNQEQLEQEVTRIFQALRQDQRLKDLDTSLRPGKPEIQFRLKKRAAQIYGINSGILGDELRAQVEGVTAAKFRQNGQEYDIRVRLQEDQRNIKESYREIYIPNINNKLIRLSDVAESNIAEGPATIDRQDRTRYIQITADIAANAGLGDIIDSVKVRLNQGDLKLPPGMRYLFIGDSENFQDLGYSILLALGFSILFIYLVLTSLYESPIIPFTIMLALPLALCGAFFALFVTHESLSLFSILGIVMLLGVASKNSILLVDYTKRLIEENHWDRTRALITAGKLRLRPILMTSMALIAGTFPVALGLNEASKQRTGMGIAIIGGLISSTLLSLIVIPSAFLYIDRFQGWATRVFSRLRGTDLKPKSMPDRLAG